MSQYSLPNPMQSSLSKFKDGMSKTESASQLSATIFLATDSRRGFTTFSHIKSKLNNIKINWKEIKDASPKTYEIFLASKNDVWDFLCDNGIWGYVFDPSLNEGSGYFWELKYMNKTQSSVSLSDCVIRSESSCINSMIWRAFKLIEDGEPMSIDDKKNTTPFDWKKAQRDVEGLMNLYTSTAIKRAKKKKRYKANAKYIQKGRGEAK